MNICAIDFETTGFSPVNDRITEIGAVLMELKSKKQHEVSTLCYEEGFPTLSEEVINVTGITDEMLKAGGIPFEKALLILCNVFGEVGWPGLFVAHNAPFDRGMLKGELERLRDKIPPAILAKLLDVPWLCTIKDIEHKVKGKCRVLSHLALEYGIAVDPKNLHRAVDDVKLMLAILQATGLDLEQFVGKFVSEVGEPRVLVRAVVPSPYGARGDGGKGKDKAKECGFSYQKIQGEDSIKEYPTMWIKLIKRSELASETEKLGGYQLAILEG